MIDQFILYLKYAYYLLLLKLTQLSQWIGQPSGTSNNQFVQKLVVFGDDLALGYGDKISFGSGIGLTFYLKTLLFKAKNIKQEWKLFNYGQYGSTSNQWHPEGPLFKKYIERNQTIEGAGLFLFSVGMYDVKKSDDFDLIINNIMETSEKISEFGKIYIYTIPDLTRNVVLKQEIHKFNKLLMERINSLNHPNIKLLLQLDSNNYEFKRIDLINGNGTHFNKKGYHKITKDSLDVIINDMVKLEFNAFSKALGY
ncbi:hypothetical protein K502DRAFT_368512 [Neoconidiobolus thromboides FSU 785]|nr:hypothetical protein K502DRAFT_368512 [Neoconidiobolus thromboides FSU 785]